MAYLSKAWRERQGRWGRLSVEAPAPLPHVESSLVVCWPHSRYTASFYDGYDFATRMNKLSCHFIVEATALLPGALQACIPNVSTRRLDCRTHC